MIKHLPNLFLIKQTSQVSVELEERSNRVHELEDVVSNRDREVKELHSKLSELVWIYYTLLLKTDRRTYSLNSVNWYGYIIH